MGNDIAEDKVVADLPKMSEIPCEKQEEREELSVYPSCAVTRAMTQQKAKCQGKTDIPRSREIDLSQTFISQLDETEGVTTFSHSIGNETDKEDRFVSNGNRPTGKFTFSEEPISDATREKLIEEQKMDPELKLLRNTAVSEKDSHREAGCYYLKSDVLMRKWRPPDSPADGEWKILYQIVIPPMYRHEILCLGHDTLLAGHLGVNKTYQKILTHFYWPGIQKDVKQFCRTCHTCQMVGKPNQKIAKYPLQPIPTLEEPFSRVIIDCVGPLPRTRTGNVYMLTIMCASTRFPEAIPLRNVRTPVVVKALIKFFTLVGLPKSIQSDQGSNFMSGIFQQVMNELGITQYSSSGYHPESQGAFERFHQTLKNMLKAYCEDNQKVWDEGIPYVLFAARESVQESLGFSPFELVFGRTVRGPLKFLKEKWLDENTEINLLDYISNFKERFTKACSIAKQNLQGSQERMKTWYDTKAQHREFVAGDKVLVLLPIPGHPFSARFYGPYPVRKKVSDTDYEIETPDRRKSKRVCHINMIKPYYDRHAENVPQAVGVNTINTVEITENDTLAGDSCTNRKEPDLKLKPTNRKELMRFLGMAGYYRRFCQNFSQVAAPLTNLLKKDCKFIWQEDQQQAFEKIKAILTNAPVLVVPDFSKPFKLYADACDIGAGAVLQQDDTLGIDHPICYFSKKFDSHQRHYSTIEKETLALILALQHFEVYLSTTVTPILVYTDHTPLVFVKKLKDQKPAINALELTAVTI
ncbi:uncharacterized protein [Haliotis asinina]|uniref:uncharacterized protein n=1 Tax=Haliotis asinina TaxID=109174 RepID=UPI003531DC88